MESSGEAGNRVGQGAQEVEEELCWINQPTWNDSLWVESNCSLDLDGNGHFIKEARSPSDYNFDSRPHRGWSTDSDSSVEDVVVCKRCRCSSLVDFEDGYAADQCESESDASVNSDDGYVEDNLNNHLNMVYDNYTDDVKLSLVACISYPKSEITEDKPFSKVADPKLLKLHRTCCDQQYKCRKKHDYLRRSSPGSILTSSTSSSSSSLAPPVNRKSRSVSPQLVRRSVEAHKADLSKSKLHRDCCKLSYQPQLPTTNIPPRKSRSYTSPPVTNRIHGVGAWNGDNATSQLSQRKRYPISTRHFNGLSFSSYRQSRSLSPQLILRSDTEKSKKWVTPTKYRACCNKHYKTPEVLPLDSFYQNNPQLRRTLPSSSSSSSTTSLAPPASRRTRSLSPQLAAAVEAHHASLSRSKVKRDCNQHIQMTSQPCVPDRKPASTKKSPRSIQIYETKTTRLRREAQLRAIQNGNIQTGATQTSQDRRSCCNSHYKSRPKFDYLRAGSGARRSPRSPGRSSFSYQHPSPSSSADNVLRQNLRHTNNTNGSPNSYNTNCRHRSGSAHKQCRSMPPNFTTSSPKHITLDETDQNTHPDGCLVCDEILLEFPTLYYKLDCSGESGDIDLESRKAKVGTVYRILDDGNVVRESDLNGTTPSHNNDGEFSYSIFWFNNSLNMCR